MAETSVALISSGGAILGALIGGTVTGLVALRGTRIQVRAQRETADKDRLDRQSERSDQRAAQHREVRRTAYVQFLEHSERVGRRLAALDALGAREAASRECRLPEEAEEALGELSRALHVVVMEGPEDVARHANEVMRAAREQFLAQVRLAAAHGGGADGGSGPAPTPRTGSGTGAETLSRLGGAQLDEVRRGRNAASTRFIEAARTVLAGPEPHGQGP